MSYTRQPGWEFQRALVAPTKNRCNILAHPLHTCPLFGDGQVWQVWASMEVARSRVAGCGGIILPNLLIFVQLAHYLGLSTLSKLEDAPSPPAPPRRGEGSQNATQRRERSGGVWFPRPLQGRGLGGEGRLLDSFEAEVGQTSRVIGEPVTLAEAEAEDKDQFQRWGSGWWARARWNRRRALMRALMGGSMPETTTAARPNRSSSPSRAAIPA